MEERYENRTNNAVARVCEKLNQRVNGEDVIVFSQNSIAPALFRTCKLGLERDRMLDDLPKSDNTR
jgi:hypothetical protein